MPPRLELCRLGIASARGRERGDREGEKGGCGFLGFKVADAVAERASRSFVPGRG